MKKLLCLLLVSSSIFASPLRTETIEQNLGAFELRNYIKNPGAEKNISLGMTDSSTILTRSTSSPLEGVAQFSIDATATSQNVDWAANTLQAGLKNQNCEARAIISGDASLYTVQVLINSVVQNSLALGNYTGRSQPISVSFPCGDLTNNPSFRITSTGNGAVILVDSVYLGLLTNSGFATVNTDWVAYTPTFTNFGTVTTIQVYSRRAGSNLEVQGKFICGSTSASIGSMTIGSNGVSANVTIDPNVIPANSSNIYSLLGHAGNSATADTISVIGEASATVVKFGSNQSSLGLTPIGTNGICSTGQQVSVHFSVPIANWTSQTVVGSSQQAQSAIRLSNGNGHGSTGTEIRRYTNIIASTGSAITYVDDASLGATFTINQAGVYDIIRSDYRTSAGGTYGISVNAGNLTTGIDVQTGTSILALCTTAAANIGETCSATAYLNAGDIVRPHDSSNMNSTDVYSRFSISQALPPGANAPISIAKTAPTVQKFTSGSGTYTVPTPAPLYLEITMAGGGGGGAAQGGNGTGGGNSTFGSSLLTAGLGAGGASTGSPGTGGTCTVNSPAVDAGSIAGGTAAQHGGAIANSAGGSGGSNMLSGGGAGGEGNTGSNAPFVPAANSGAGGGGAGPQVGSSGYAGGGAACVVKAIINNPVAGATYAYAVGAAGAAGTTGTSGAAAAGAAGIVVVKEFYQ